MHSLHTSPEKCTESSNSQKIDIYEKYTLLKHVPKLQITPQNSQRPRIRLSSPGDKGRRSGGRFLYKAPLTKLAGPPPIHRNFSYVRKMARLTEIRSHKGSTKITSGLHTYSIIRDVD